MWGAWGLLLAAYLLVRLLLFLLILAARGLSYGTAGVIARLRGRPPPARKPLKAQIMDDWKAWIERREREEDEKMGRFKDWFHPDDAARRP